MGSPRPHARRRPRIVRRRTLLLAVLGATVGLLAITGVASADIWSPESGGSKNADSIDTLYKLVFVLGIIVFVGVWGTLIYALFRFRARKGAVAAQIRGNTRLEIGWTVGAALILVVLSIVTFLKLPDIRNPPPTGPNGYRAATGVLVAAGPKERLPKGGGDLHVCVNGQ